MSRKFDSYPFFIHGTDYVTVCINLRTENDTYLLSVEKAFDYLVRFQNVPVRTTSGTKYIKQALLTEEQGTLYMTFSRNTKKVIKAKVALVFRQ